MSDNKLVKTIMDAATLTGLAAGISWIAKKVVKQNFTADPSSERCHELRQVHRCHGWQHRAEKISIGQEDSS